VNGLEDWLMDGHRTRVCKQWMLEFTFANSGDIYGVSDSEGKRPVYCISITVCYTSDWNVRLWLVQIASRGV